MTWKQRFGLWFMAKRVKQGLNRKSLAQKLGISESSVSLIEKGRRLPDGELFLQIAQLFGCNIEEVVIRKMMAATGRWVVGAEKFLPQYPTNPEINTLVDDLSNTAQRLSDEERSNFYTEISRTLDVWEGFVVNKLRSGIE